MSYKGIHTLWVWQRINAAMGKYFHLALCVIATLLASLIYTQGSSGCPPDTGIYLMLKNECISNGTWFRDTNLEIAKGQDGYIHCVLLNETLNGGQWVRPNGQPVDCINGAIEESGPYKEDPFFCTDDSPNANITLYLENDGYFQPTAGGNIGIETEYKCCLPTNCSDPNTNIMTINVFERVYIIDVYVDPPSDITAIPQYYTVHCIVTGSLNDVTTVIKQYYVDPTVDDTSDDTELSQSYCSNTYTGYSCTVTNTSIITTYNTYDDTRDYTVTVEWEGESISISAFRQSSNNGDHVHLCTAASGAIEPKHKGRSILMTVRAPSSSPTNVSIIDVTLTSISIQWSYPDISDDVDGYVINASSLNDDYVTQQVTTSNHINVTSTLNGLLPGTTYNITVRAYQDILGPPNDEVSDTTLDAPNPMIIWSLHTNITDLLNAQYLIQCDTASNNVNPSLIYWTIDGVKLPNTSFILDGSNYTSSLVQNLNNELGQSVNITCSIEGVINTTEVLKAPPMSPQDVSVTQPSLYDSTISISWSPLPSSDGFIVTISPNYTVYWYNSSTTQATITGLTPNVYTITVYAYNDLISAGVSKNINITIVSSSSIDAIPTAITVFSTTTQQYTPLTSLSSSSIHTSPSTTPGGTSTSSTDDTGSSSLPIVIGVVVGCLVVLIIVVVVVIIAVCFVSKRRRRTEQKPKDKARTPLGIINDDFVDSKSEDGFILAEKPSKREEKPSMAVTQFYDDIVTAEATDEPDPVKLDQVLDPPTLEGTTGNTTCPEEDNIADTTGITLIDDDEEDEEDEYVNDGLGPDTATSPYESMYASIPEAMVQEGFNNQILPVNPIKNDDLWEYVNERDVQNLQLEFKTLYTGEERKVDIGKSKQNMNLNRFKNVIPYDDNRVTMKALNYEGCVGDFINASYIDGYSMPRKFIAAQGPLNNTVQDFIRLIWLEKVHIIVMVTNLREGGRSKCEQYWPSKTADEDHGVEEYGPFTVVLRNVMKYPDYTMRIMEIKFENESRQVIQYQLTSWPDHGVLEYPSPLILVHKRVMNKWHSLGGPLLVHCSAGVGRTGTFITMDLALEQAMKQGVVDIAGIVTRLRQQRTKMVQTEDQYIFIHDAILEVLTCGDTEISSNEFIQKLKEMKRTNVLDSQFTVLSQETPSPDEVITDTALGHPDKNRSDKYLPADKHIVPLLQRNGYINATFVKAYNQLRGMIIAQSPMETTVNDFWTMIMQYKVPAIVMCCELSEAGEETCYQYWPSTEESTEYGNLKVTLTSTKTEENGFIRRELKIQSLENVDSQLSVTQFQITNWSSSGVVSNPQTMIVVIDDVINVQKKIGGGPVVVHCSDTVSRSGVYCAVSNAIEQCKAEGAIDVFQTVKTLRMNKPGAVTTLDQYITVHDTASTYLAANQLYANFL